MKSTWALLLPLALLGCDKPEVAACEVFLKGGLRSPSTYHRVSVNSYDGPLGEPALTQMREEDAERDRGNPEWAKIKRGLEAQTPAAQRSQDTLREVFIEYDAANAYGTPIRGAQQCGFVLRNGELPSADSLRAKVSKAESARALRQLRGDDKDPAYSCCL